MSDDHASHALSCYGSRINQTPNLDRIANKGMRFNNCFCTNSICAPSRASILTGTYNHINGVTTLDTNLDGRQFTFPRLLKQSGYQTAIIGKWHLGHGGIHDPTGFDYWNILPGQGLYYNPQMIEMGKKKIIEGYVTNIITDLSLKWLRKRDKKRPFCLLYHHKAPHRPWEPDDAHSQMYKDFDIPEPETFNDNYSNRASAAKEAEMRVDRDLSIKDLKLKLPIGLTPQEEKKWKYQRYIKDYLRCVASIDDNVGRLLNFLDKEGLTENTIVIYTSDQGFFLGDHGWYDKRFMYEESLRMPFIIRYPEDIKPGSINNKMILNVDFSPTLLDYAGIKIPKEIQGVSIRPLLRGQSPNNWRTSMYYRYWMHLSQHNVYAHYGVRTLQHKLIYYYADGLHQPGAIEDSRKPEWELFDLDKDPYELNNVYHDLEYAIIRKVLKSELHCLQKKIGDEPYKG